VRVFRPLFIFVIADQTVPIPALEGVCCHAEGATPFRLGCSRRERYTNLCV
jgi:hypothetical protein